MTYTLFDLLFLPQKGKASDGATRAEEGGAQKKDERENQLRRIKSRELRGGIMYYSCHCIKRNGLQHDCRRTGCQGEPACLTLPDPVCLPSQLARARGLADPAPLAAHMRGHGGANYAGPSNTATGGGKKFIVCELKGVAPDVATNNTGKCCKCPVVSIPPQAHGRQVCDYSPAALKQPPQGDNAQKCPCVVFTGSINKALAPRQTPAQPQTPVNEPRCVCSSNLNSNAKYVFDKRMTQSILDQFETKHQNAQGGFGPNTKLGNRLGQKEECTRPGCVHWKPPPPCVWDLPCKADCFEAPAGIQPGRNPWGNSKTMKCVFESSEVTKQGKAAAAQRTQPQPTTRAVLKILTPECCVGCCTPASDSGAVAAAASGGPGVGMPVLVMKLC